MPTTFLHLADVHLGYQQYQSEERLKDFSRVFRQAIDDALEKEVDFVLIVGDLFHKAAINPITLLQAKRPLDQLREAKIPAIAINGNHDSTRYGNRFSWLDYLEADGCLTVLKPTFSKGGQIEFVPSNGPGGGYIDIKGVRVIGLNYLGASTPSVLEELPGVIEKLPHNNHFTILMAHFGLEGEVPNLNGAISHNTIAPLRQHINYLALGHIHKPVERDNWIYNPGSLEACGMDERHWHGGWYHVTVDSNTHQVQHIKSKRRPMHRIRIEVDGYDTPATLYDAVRSQLEDHNQAIKLGQMQPVVQLWLEGVLAFDRHDLDTRFIEEMVVEVIGPLKALVRNNTRSTEYEIVMDERLDRAELERSVFTDLIIRDSRYRDQAEAWANLMLEVRTMTLSGNDPEDIATAISKRMISLTETTDVEDTTRLKSKLTQLKAELEDQDVD
jgi:DNA repair exonuclease SbcCD nuclease subunit